MQPEHPRHHADCQRRQEVTSRDRQRLGSIHPQGGINPAEDVVKRRNEEAHRPDRGQRRRRGEPKDAVQHRLVVGDWREWVERHGGTRAVKLGGEIRGDLRLREERRTVSNRCPLAKGQVSPDLKALTANLPLGLCNGYSVWGAGVVKRTQLE